MSAMSPAAGATTEPIGRPPGDDECHVCGWYPAAPVRVRRSTGMIIVWRRERYDVTACHPCAQSAFRDAQAHTLTFGWWGFASFVATLVVLVLNLFHIVRHRGRTGTPVGRREDVATEVTTPLRSRSVLLRPAAVLVSLFIAGLVAFSAWGVQLASEDPDPTDTPAVGDCFSAGGELMACTDTGAAYEVTSVVQDAKECTDVSFSDEDGGAVYCVVTYSGAGAGS